MKYDIDFYFGGSYTSIFQSLCAPDSPLESNRKEEGRVILNPKNNKKVEFGYSTNDITLLTGRNRFHEKLQEVLGFKPASHMIYDEVNLEDSEIINTLKEVIDYVVNKELPFYLITEDEEIHKTFIVGRSLEKKKYKSPQLRKPLDVLLNKT